MKREVSAGTIVYYTEKTEGSLTRFYLLLYYRNKYWDFPKGKLEGNETYEEAALRELTEETGLVISLEKGFKESISYLFKDQTGSLVDKTVVYFIGESPTKKVTLSEEHIDFKWLPFKESLSLLTYANAQHVLSLGNQFIERSREDEDQSSLSSAENSSTK